MAILLIGSGGREHALAKKLSQSPSCDKLYCVGGNVGIADYATCIDVSLDDIDGIVELSKDLSVNLVVVGPEAPLVDGLGDKLRAAGIATFGANANAARLEGSKGFMKDLCASQNIPTAAYGRFTDYEKAADFIKSKGAPIVVKADGLAAGKGVIVAESVDDALTAAKDMLLENAFGDSGKSIVVEEFLDGREVSFFALSDGKTVKEFGHAQDHKRAYDGDKGANTGGMGAYSPSPLVTPALSQKIMDTIITPTINGMRDMGAPFVGVLFAGLMIVDDEPYLIEHNVRFGDPECQVLMPRLEGDLVEILYAAATGKLDEVEFRWSKNHALCVVMAAKGYPSSYKKGSPINGVDDAQKHASVIHAGTATNKGGQLIANGGRVLGIVASAPTMKEAQQKAYAAVDCINWPQGFCRRDIGGNNS